MTEKRNKRQAKFYLSREALELLAAESTRSTYPMSTLVDMFIKERLGEPNVAPGRLNDYIKPNVLDKVERELRKVAHFKPRQEPEPEPATVEKKEFRLDF